MPVKFHDFDMFDAKHNYERKNNNNNKQYKNKTKVESPNKL